MSPEATNQIGSVVTLNGTAWAVTAGGDRFLQQGDPVHEGESIVTGKNANLEIKFLDGTLLGQGEEARVDLDEYVFDGSGGMLDFQMLTGVMRMVSGKIAEADPEAFNVSTPLVTIGIRGTEIIAKIDVNGQIIGVTEMSEGHYVVIASPEGEIRIDAPGLFSGVDADGFLIQTQALSQDFVNAVQAAVPLTSIGESPRNPDDPQPDVPDPSDDTAGQGGPDGEPVPEPGQEQVGDQPDSGQQETVFTPPQAVEPPPPPLASGPEPAVESVTATPPDDNPDPEPEEDDPLVEDIVSSTAGETWTDHPYEAAYYVATDLDDTLSGLDMDDTLYGEAGNDHIDAGDGNDDVHGGEGDDSIQGGYGYDAISGGAGNDTMDGGAGYDTLEGDAGNDSMQGGSENDVLLGDDGDDQLYGGGENDFLAGDDGKDSLMGGTGSDTFFFSSPVDGADAIADFDSHEDLIGLDASDHDFGALAFDSGHIAMSDFFTVQAEEYDGHISGESGAGIVYASESGSSSGKLYFDPDLSNPGDEYLLAEVSEVDGDVTADDVIADSEPGLS